MGNGCLAGVPFPRQVDVDRVLPGLLGEVGELTERVDSGIRTHDVEPPELGDAVGQDAGQLGVIANVGLGRDDPAIEPFHQRDGLVQVVPGGHRRRHRGDLTADVHGDDVGAFLGQSDRMAPALAPGGSGDERDLAFHPTRSGLPPVYAPTDGRVPCHWPADVHRTGLTSNERGSPASVTSTWSVRPVRGSR